METTETTEEMQETLRFSPWSLWSPWLSILPQRKRHDFAAARQCVFYPAHSGWKLVWPISNLSRNDWLMRSTSAL